MNSSIRFIIILAMIYPQFIAAQEIKYNKMTEKACHNCYEPKYAQRIEDVFEFTSIIEIDIWDSEIFSGILTSLTGGNRMEQDWYVKHEIHNRGNLNCCGGTFKDCLQRINAWSNQNPNHDVITIFIDKEENWSEANEKRGPTDLDQLLNTIFTKHKIFSPGDLAQNNLTLREASVNNWQSLNQLKGKFIFVLTDANSNLNTTGRKPLNEYIESLHTTAVCFVAPEISNEEEILNPPGLTLETSHEVIFFNLNYSKRLLAKKINSMGFLSRVYGAPIPETKDVLDSLVALKVNFIALYNFKL